MRILLATDEPGRARSLGRLLDSIGHAHAVLADAGAMAEAIGTGDFDLVLMEHRIAAGIDLGGREVPGCDDGATTGRPVIALGGFPGEEDRRRAIESGFDDVLADPVDGTTLHAMLVRFEGTSGAGPRGGTGGETDETPAFDRSEALDNLGGDAEFLGEMLELFFADWPRVSSEYGAAVAASDPASLRRVAHSVAGAAGTLAAASVVWAARRLEAIGQSGVMDGAAECWAELEREIERFRAAANSFGSVPRGA